MPIRRFRNSWPTRTVMDSIEHSSELKSEPVLVTGASGFIGSRVVQRLVDLGFERVRCLVRSSSGADRLQSAADACSERQSIEIVTGDLTSRQDCARAAAGVSIVYHLAAGFDKSFAGAFMSSALGTRNLLDALLKNPPLHRFVNVSSFAVYSNRTLARGAVLDETTPLEDAFQERSDAYGYGKLKQEEVVRQYGCTHGLPYVILRPGTVFGPGKPALTGRIGIDTFGFFMHVGGSNALPLTYVDNCADAIVLAGTVPGAEGKTFNVVDDDTLTSTQFLRAYKRSVPPFFSLRLPYAVAYALCAMWEDYSKFSKGQLPPAFNRRRCMAEWKGNRFPNAAIRAGLGWAPRVSMVEAMKEYCKQFEAAAG